MILGYWLGSYSQKWLSKICVPRTLGIFFWFHPLTFYDLHRFMGLKTHPWQAYVSPHSVVVGYVVSVSTCHTSRPHGWLCLTRLTRWTSTNPRCKMNRSTRNGPKHMGRFAIKHRSSTCTWNGIYDTVANDAVVSCNFSKDEALSWPAWYSSKKTLTWNPWN